jgi:predicted  nucleic acid-binding Zn-ribbon protein
MIMARATKDYLYDKIERQRERLRNEGREEGRETLASEIEDWNRRRLEAERRGEPFDEPPPGV